MKKLFTLFTAVMLVFALGANAQSRKTWDFTKGVSDATRALLDSDGNWLKTPNDDGSTKSWQLSLATYNGELAVKGEILSEFSGLYFSNITNNNSLLYFGTKLRLAKVCKVTLPSLTAGQKITISAQSANANDTNRGFVFTNAVNENNENTILVPPGSAGSIVINLTVVADGVVDIETGVTGAAAGVEINSIIIDEGDKNIKKWDFSAWSEATKAQVTTAEDWTKAESATKEYITGDEIRWCLAPTMDANGDLVAGGAAIAEMKGLRHTGLAAYSYGIAFDYKQTLDGNNWGPYNGGSYLWVMGAATSITVPNVKAGSTFKLGVETHKLIPTGTSDARGFKVTVNGAEVGTTQTATDYKEFEYTIPAGADEYVDVVVTATKGCHLYFIEAEVKDETVVDKNPNLGAPTYSIKNGAKINPKIETGFTIKFPKAQNLAENQKITLAYYLGPAVLEDGDVADNYLYEDEVSVAEGTTITYLDILTDGMKENTAYEFYITSIIVPGFDALNEEAAEGEKLYELSFETTGPGINVERSWDFSNITKEVAEQISKSFSDGVGYWGTAKDGRYTVKVSMFANGNQQLMIDADTPLPATEGLYFSLSQDDDILVGTPTHDGAAPNASGGKHKNLIFIGGGQSSLIIPSCNAGDEVTVKAAYNNSKKGNITITNGTYNDAASFTAAKGLTEYKIIVTENGDLSLKANEVKFTSISVFPSTIEKKEVEYTVNIVEGEGKVIKAAIATGKAMTNDNISVPYSYWITDAEGNVYTKGSKGSEFKETFVIENDKADYNLVYNTTAYGKAVYCMEGEDIEGALACTNTTTVIRSSGTKAAYNDQDITLTTLQPGSYKVKAVLFANNKTGGCTMNFTVGAEPITMNNGNSDNFIECESELIEVTEATPLVWQASGDENNGLDIIMVYESEDIPDGVNGVAENGSVSAKTVKVVKDGRVVIESANGTYTVAGAQMK